jgi:hypothetical protein
MLKTIPLVAAERCFALKGGTAINLFVRDMPRLSVDIDLTYLPFDEVRDAALSNMTAALGRIAVPSKRASPVLAFRKPAPRTLSVSASTQI